MLAAMPHQIPLPVTIDVKPPRKMKAHPAPGQDDEALRVVALLEKLRAQRRHPRHRSFSLVAAIGRNRLKLREAPAYFVEDQPSSTNRFEIAQHSR